MYDQSNILSYFKPEVVSGQLDLTATPLYDSFTIAQNSALTTALSSLFTIPLNQSSKTYGQTNLKQSSKLQTGEIFAVMAIRNRISEQINFTDFWTILNSFAYRFFLGTDKPFQLAPIWLYPAGGGIYGTIFDSTASTQVRVLSNGVPSTDAVRQLATPIPIDSNMSFSADLIGAASYTLIATASGGVGVTFYSVLDGIWGRLVM